MHLFSKFFKRLPVNNSRRKACEKLVNQPVPTDGIWLFLLGWKIFYSSSSDLTCSGVSPAALVFLLVASGRGVPGTKVLAFRWISLSWVLPSRVLNSCLAASRSFSLIFLKSNTWQDWKTMWCRLCTNLRSKQYRMMHTGTYLEKKALPIVLFWWTKYPFFSEQNIDKFGQHKQNRF